MAWILIALIASSNARTTVVAEYGSHNTCVTAGKQLMKEAGTVYFLCTKK